MDYVYLWADGIHLNVRLDEEKLCLLVMIGVRVDGTKELVALADGYRESTGSWADLLRDCKRRGMRAPVLAVGDGALGFWGALREVFPETREQRCWFHKIANVLAALPKSAHPGAKKALAEIWNAEDRDHARRAVAAFKLAYGAKFAKAVAKITDDLDELLAFYDYPAEHWIHLRTTNPIESTFATVRHRTKVTKGPGSKAAGLAMAFKLIEAAQARWRAVNAPHLVALVRAGATFKKRQARRTTRANVPNPRPPKRSSSLRDGPGPVCLARGAGGAARPPMSMIGSGRPPSTIYQALIEAELTAVIGAGPHERTETRVAQRNGHRPRMLSTTAGDLELRIPKLRTGSFFPSLLERRRRVDQALFAVVMEAYLHGVSAPGRSTTWSRRWAPTPASPSPRCPGSAPTSTPRSARSATAVLAGQRVPLRVPRRHLLQGPGQPPGGLPGRRGGHRGPRRRLAGGARASPSATARTARSGPRSCAR